MPVRSVNDQKTGMTADGHNVLFMAGFGHNANIYLYWLLDVPYFGFRELQIQEEHVMKKIFKKRKW